MNAYDFDGTIYNGDSTVDFYLYALRKHPALLRYVPKQALGFVLYGLKKIDKTRLKEYFYAFLQGIDSEELVEKFWERNASKVYDWYKLQQEPDDVLISASPEFLLKPICQRLGIQYLIASKVDCHTGLYTGKNCYGPEKVNRLHEELGEVSIGQFYSDSNSDRYLAVLAEKAFLVQDGNVIAWENLCK